MKNNIATELRIGNLVQDKSKRLCRVEGLNLEGINAPAISGPITTLPGDPIPLTEKWLLKFGFEAKKWRDEVEWYCLDITNKESSNTRIFIDLREVKIKASIELYADNQSGGVIRLPNFYNVHQLQNLYFALTGKELTSASTTSP